MLSFFPREFLDVITDLIESVSESFPTYFYKFSSILFVYIHFERTRYDMPYVNVQIHIRAGNLTGKTGHKSSVLAVLMPVDMKFVPIYLQCV